MSKPGVGALGPTCQLLQPMSEPGVAALGPTCQLQLMSKPDVAALQTTVPVSCCSRCLIQVLPLYVLLVADV